MNEQKVAQLLATGRYATPKTYPPQEPPPPSGKWPTPQYRERLARKQANRARWAEAFYISIRRPGKFTREA